MDLGGEELLFRRIVELFFAGAVAGGQAVAEGDIAVFDALRIFTIERITGGDAVGVVIGTSGFRARFAYSGGIFDAFAVDARESFQ